MEELKSCRICLKEDLTKAISFRKITKLSGLTFSGVYQYVTGFTIEETGPQHLCPECAKDLCAAYLFKKKCEENENRFQRKVKEEPIEKPEVDVKIFEDNNFFEPEVSNSCTDEEFKEEKTGPNEPKNSEQTFEKKSELTNHQKIVQKSSSYKKNVASSNDLYICDFCNKNFKARKNILDHLRDQHINKTHKCKSCEKVFDNRYKLRAHNNKIHKQKSDTTFCPHCGKSLNIKSLAYHINMVHNKTETNMYICDFCKNEYNSKTSILNHIKYHHLKTTRKGFVCRYCTETFDHGQSRRYHEVTIHTKDYKHICSICGLKCYNSATFRRHMISHSGEKNHMCNQCGARFGRRNALKNHIATHVVTKDFICKTCNAAFKTAKNLYSHETTQHRERKFECPKCRKKFLIERTMKEHCSKVHPDHELQKKTKLC